MSHVHLLVDFVSNHSVHLALVLGLYMALGEQWRHRKEMKRGLWRIHDDF